MPSVILAEVPYRTGDVSVDENFSWVNTKLKQNAAFSQSVSSTALTGITSNAYQFTGTGTSISPLTLNPSSVTLQGVIHNIDGNAATATNANNANTVTNGVYTTGTYADPAWITSLSTSKVNLSTVTTAIDEKVAKTGDTMTGQLTVVSSITAIGDVRGASLYSGSSIAANGYIFSDATDTGNSAIIVGHSGVPAVAMNGDRELSQGLWVFEEGSAEEIAHKLDTSTMSILADGSAYNVMIGGEAESGQTKLLVNGNMRADNYYGNGNTLSNIITSTSALQVDINSRVRDTGDTMTGGLTMLNSPLTVSNSSITVVGGSVTAFGYYGSISNTTGINVTHTATYSDLEDPTGFINLLTSSITLSGKTFQIAGTQFPVYINGYKVLKDTQTIEVDDATQLTWIYYNASGTLSKSAAFPGFDNTLIASVYYSTRMVSGLLGDERHGASMPWRVHEYVHETIGARYASGMSLTVTGLTASISSGEFYDDDHEIITPTSTSFDILYKNGSSFFDFTLSTTAYFTQVAGQLVYNNGNVLTSAGNNYVAYWIFATPFVDSPFVVVTGNRVDATLANARANNTLASLSLTGFPTAELKPIYRILMQSVAGTPTYVENADYRSVSELPGANYVATEHSSLTGLELTSANHPYDVVGGFSSYDYAKSIAASTGSFLTAPATFYVVKNTDYLQAPATSYWVKASDYLVSPATFSYLQAPATFYIVPTTAYLSNPATFYVVKNTDYLQAPATSYWVKSSDYLVSPASFTYLIAPATFSYLSNASAFLAAPATFTILTGPYLTSPATFTILTGSYLTAPATFYVVKNSDYLVAPATFSYLSNASAFLTAPATSYWVKSSDYLVAPASFSYLSNSSAFLTAPATSYWVNSSDYLVAPASFTYLNNANAFLTAPATSYWVKTSDYLVSPATFTILTGAGYVPYTGATTDLNLGTNRLSAGPLTASSVTVTGGGISVVNAASANDSLAINVTQQDNDQYGGAFTSSAYPFRFIGTGDNDILATVGAGTNVTFAGDGFSVGGSTLVVANGLVGVNNASPLTLLDLKGVSTGAPATSGTVPAALATIRSASHTGMYIGNLGTTPYTFWLQNADPTNLGDEYPIALNPNGGNVGIGTAGPSQRLEIAGQSGSPANTGTTQNGIFRMSNNGGTSNSLVLDMGQEQASPYTTWIQSSVSGDLSAHFPIALNPLGGNVGIGTASPGGKLQIEGSTGGSYFAADYANTLNAAYGGNQTENLWLNYVGYQGGTTQFRNTLIGNGKGTAVVSVDGPTGNVGIGVSAPVWNLEVGNASGSRIAATDNGGASKKVLAMDSPTTANPYAQIFGYDYGGSVGLPLTVPYGNVGIGTSAPLHKLDVHSTDKYHTVSVHNLGGATGDVVGVDFKHYTNPAVVGPTRAFIHDEILSGWGTNLHFGTVEDGASFYTVNASTKMTISDVGNVGIGDTSPTAKLDIAYNNAIVSGVKLTNTEASGGTWYLNENSGAGEFTIYGGATPAERFTIGTTGNIGIANTSPSYALDITGALQASGQAIIKGTATVTGGDFMVRGSNPLIQLKDTSEGNYVFLQGLDNANGGPALRVYDGTDYTMYFKGGSVGIGATAPTAKLVVAGNIVSSGTINAKDGLCINNSCKTSWPATLGDITAAGDNTFTGANTFNSSTTFNGTVYGATYFKYPPLGSRQGTARVSSGASQLLGTKYKARDTATITHISLWHADCNSGNIKYAIYSDGGTKPGSLLGETAGISITSADNGYDVIGTLGTPVTLTRGTIYWLVTLSDVTINTLMMNTVGWGYYPSFYIGGYSYAGGFPANFTSITPTAWQYEFSFWAY